jgi:hydroxymethylbilane synthase
MRLGLAERIRGRFEPAQMIPAAGQGALGLEVREDAQALRALLLQTSHLPTYLAVQAERAVSRSLGGSCSMPLAAHAIWADDDAGAAPGAARRLTLVAALGDSADLKRPLLRVQLRAEMALSLASEAQARALGDQAAVQLQALGAGSYLGASASQSQP